MNDECMICGAALEYLETSMEMECAVCGKRERSRTRCVNGHYVCDECHTKGLSSIVGLCLQSRSANPVKIFEAMLALPFCHMHGPEHHVMVGAALLTAYKNAGGAIDLEKALLEMGSRGRGVPGGACGFWGACGAAISTGMYFSIVTGSTPLATKEWGLSNRMTACALEKIGNVGGPRCCKRNAYLSILEAVRFTRETLGVTMEQSTVLCTRSGQNNQCLKIKCPFYGGKRDAKED